MVQQPTTSTAFDGHPADRPVVIEAVELTKRFGDTVAVDRVSFTVQRGEVVGLLGPNGAGKTTILQMLLGTLLPTAGRIRVLGMDLATHRDAILPHSHSGDALQPHELGMDRERDVFDGVDCHFRAGNGNGFCTSPRAETSCR